MESSLFPKNERLLNRKDFVNLNRLGKRYRTKHFTVIFKENGLGISRLGITVSKKIGNAVKRNRVKRYIREFFRANKKKFPNDFDVVIIANKGANDLIFCKIKEELGEIIPDKKFSL
ncbi:ribonuclease P protein component [Deltaproteobacteria bacterium]|nr:ribonuclease P protein component [Deltaproteobacteria bacterium]